MTKGSKFVLIILPYFLNESNLAELSKNSGLLCGFGFSTTLSIFPEGKFSWDKESRPFSCQSSAIGCNFGLSDCLRIPKSPYGIVTLLNPPHIGYGG